MLRCCEVGEPVNGLMHWSGDEPMTGAQASYLKTLCEQAHSDAFDENLTKAEASKLIEEMREKAGVSNVETH